MKVLVADDDATYCRILTEFLAEGGHEVTMAERETRRHTRKKEEQE